MKGKKGNLLAWILERRALSLAVLILALAVIMSLTTDTFLRSENLFNIFKQATITIILATGMTFIISGGGIDLSVANIMSLSCVMSCIVYNATHSDILSLPQSVTQQAPRTVFSQHTSNFLPSSFRWAFPTSAEVLHLLSQRDSRSS